MVNTIVNNPMVITGKLEANKEDISVENDNIDLVGHLSGAPIKIYENDVLIDTAMTLNNGIYTYYYTPTTTGTKQIKAVFEGTKDYNRIVSSVLTVNVNATP